MKIAVDIYGGDYAPDEVLKACNIALENNASIKLVMVGKEKEILEKIEQYPLLKGVEIINATEVVDCNDSPYFVFKRKPNSSIVLGLNAVKERDDIIGFVSAGSSGALLMTSYKILGCLDGISRPGFCPVLPTNKETKAVLIDCGANPDCAARNLYDFAILGSEFIRATYKIEKPRVCILSNGTEDIKGSKLSKEAFELIKDMQGIDFKGNIEARDIVSGDYDVIVTDGFTGNVALKAFEGSAGLIFSNLKEMSQTGSIKTKLGFLLLKSGLRGLKSKLDYTEQGGAIFLGLNGIVAKAHGSAKAKSIAATINLVYSASVNGVLEKISENIRQKQN